MKRTANKKPTAHQVLGGAFVSEEIAATTAMIEEISTALGVANRFRDAAIDAEMAGDPPYEEMLQRIIAFRECRDLAATLTMKIKEVTE